MDDWGQMLSGMVQAVRDEVEHTRRRDVGRTWQLHSGHRAQGSSEGACHYRFHMGGGRTPRPGIQGILRMAGHAVPASVARSAKAWVELSVLDDLGGPSDEASFFVRDDILISRLLDQLRARARDIETESLAHRFASGGPSCGVAPGVQPKPEDNRGLNAHQRSAVQVALQQDLCWLWGPPGTGKTWTAAGVARAWVRRGQSVLLIAPTNRAVDRLLDTLILDGELSGLVEAGRVLRVGSMDDPDIEMRLGAQVALGQVVSRLGAPIQSRIRHLLAEAEAIPCEGGTASDHRSDRRERLLGEARSLDGRLEQLPRTLLRDAQVVATTVHRAALGWLGREFDAAVLDEASMVSLPWATAAVLPVRKQVLVAGDPHQLGPVVRSPSQCAQVWLGRSPMDTGGEAEDAPSRVMLTEQYRMHPVLCQVVSRYSYGGILRTAPSVQRPGLAPGLPSPLLYLDTSRAGAKCLRPRRGGSRINPVQAGVVADLVQEVRRFVPDHRISVITPYVAQSELLRREIRKRSVPGPLDVGTVHVLQGSATPVIILDLTDAPGLPLGHFMRAGRPTEPGGRLLTVAMSRAEHHAIVVGDLPWLARAVRSTHEPPGEGMLLRLLRLVEEFGQPLERPVGTWLSPPPRRPSRRSTRHRLKPGK